MIITFCGHSEIREKEKLFQRLLAIIKEKAAGKEVSFYLGGYGDFDGMALRASRAYRDEHPSAKLIFVTPYLDENYLKRRKERLRDYDEILFPELEEVPSRYAILRRNEWMVRKADLVIAYVEYGWGGAAKTFKYAVKRQKNFINLGKKQY